MSSLTSYNEINDQVNVMENIIAKEKASNPNSSVINILSQSKYQSNVQEAVSKNWQVIETEIMDSIIIQVEQQEKLNEELQEEVMTKLRHSNNKYCTCALRVLIVIFDACGFICV